MSNQIKIDEIEIVYMSNSHIIPAFRITDYYDDVVCELPNAILYDIKLLKTICESKNEKVQDIIAHVKSNKKGVTINQHFYEFDEISDILQ